MSRTASQSGSSSNHMRPLTTMRFVGWSMFNQVKSDLGIGCGVIGCPSRLRRVENLPDPRGAVGAYRCFVGLAQPLHAA